ncbi:LysR family transcriptional regulator [Bordetella genomosp. 5]|uniref:LysR family transcriptional regulator n=1 Tax=Bordetella genomosp. 5 TaxID=1395608 RepID=UPI000B9DD316|nr:LysR family transcriptional regulator [Bordetella genomosp. 5]OZI39866.1 LysR family transcriptional regulator [Bordetella genomosp. 5]
MTAERLEDLRLLVAAADAGSFSQAARDLDLTPAVASAAIKRLEQALGVRLFARSTRSLRLTADGERYCEHVRQALAALQRGRQAVEQEHDGVAGTLSLSMPSDLGRHVLLPWLDAFQSEHPKVRLRVFISDRLADLYRQPVDLAIRYGTPDDSNMVALPLAPHNRRVLCAAPAYIARHGAPATPQDLRAHNCLTFMLGDAVHDRWTFVSEEGRSTTVAVNGDRAGDDGDMVRRWAVQGAGIAYKSGFDVAADLAAGRLLPLLPDYVTESTPVYLLCVHRASLSPAVRRLRDFLQARFAHYGVPDVS